MNRPMRQISLLLLLLACLFPCQALGQENARLFDLEVDKHLTLVDPGLLVPEGYWQVGDSGMGLFDRAGAFTELTHTRLLVVEGDGLFLVDIADGTRELVYSLPGIWGWYADGGTIYLFNHGEQGWGLIELEIPF